MSQNLTESQLEAIISQGWEFDITSDRKWAKNANSNSYIHGEFVIDYLIEEAEEILGGHIRISTLQEQLDKFKLKLLKTNPVIIQHEDGSLSQGQAGEWLLQHILDIKQW